MKNPNMPFDKYTIEARLYPAVATLPPFILLNYYYLQMFLSDFVDALFGLVIGGVSLLVVSVFLLMEVNRFLSKMFLESRYFHNELHLPTTNFLLYSDRTFSEEYKNKIRYKISKDFDFKLPSKHEESKDELSGRLRISEAVSLVRAKMKGGRLLLQHNIHYGAARNLIGGSFLAMPISLLDLIIFLEFSPNSTAAGVAVVFLLLYGALIVFSKQILYAHGKQYAKILYQEYLAN